MSEDVNCMNPNISLPYKQASRLEILIVISYNTTIKNSIIKNNYCDAKKNDSILRYKMGD